MLHGKHEATRISAAEMLAARLWGRPLQEVQLSGQVDHLHLLASWSDEELEQLVGMRGLLPMPETLGELPAGTIMADPVGDEMPPSSTGSDDTLS